MLSAVRQAVTDCMGRPIHRLLLVIAACLATLPASAQRGAITVPRNLDQLTDRAAHIVRGTVVSARVEKHPRFTNLDTVVVSLRVRESIKGSAGNEFRFRQYIWDVRDRLDAAGYRKGQDLLLLMRAPNRNGLSSPAGLEQGRFRIERDARGREIALNGHGNMRLFDGLRAVVEAKGVALTPRQASLVAKHRGGPIEARELTALIRQLARSD
jgi:hypothetical protein